MHEDGNVKSHPTTVKISQDYTNLDDQQTTIMFNISSCIQKRMISVHNNITN